MTALKAGVKAPDFQLLATPHHFLSLADFSSRPVILVFYPADWSPVCSDQLVLYNELVDDFRYHKAELLAISVDGAWCHQAFAQQRHFQFPLLADFEPKGRVAQSYGVYRDREGVAERALFVLDEKGFIYWSDTSPAHINPGADGILNALENLHKKVALM